MHQNTSIYKASSEHKCTYKDFAEVMRNVVQCVNYIDTRIIIGNLKLLKDHLNTSILMLCTSLLYVYSRSMQTLKRFCNLQGSFLEHKHLQCGHLER